MASYTIAEQQSIRSKLRAYAKAHGIGAVRLARSVKEPSGLTVPVRTMTRFLSGDRVNQMALGAIAKFVERVEDPVIVLGEALSRQGTFATDDISGNYILTRNNIECPVTITPEQGFWRMVEHDRDRARIYEGIVIHMAGVYVAHLKDNGFGLPRHYHLVKQDAAFCDVDRAGQITLRPAS